MTNTTKIMNTRPIIESSEDDLVCMSCEDIYDRKDNNGIDSDVMGFRAIYTDICDECIKEEIKRIKNEAIDIEREEKKINAMFLHLYENKKPTLCILPGRSCSFLEGQWFNSSKQMTVYYDKLRETYNILNLSELQNWTCMKEEKTLTEYFKIHNDSDNENRVINIKKSILAILSNHRDNKKPLSFITYSESCCIFLDIINEFNDNHLLFEYVQSIILVSPALSCYVYSYIDDDFKINKILEDKLIFIFNKLPSRDTIKGKHELELWDLDNNTQEKIKDSFKLQNYSITMVLRGEGASMCNHNWDGQGCSINLLNTLLQLLLPDIITGKSTKIKVVNKRKTKRRKNKKKKTKRRKNKKKKTKR